MFSNQLFSSPSGNACEERSGLANPLPAVARNSLEWEGEIQRQGLAENETGVRAFGKGFVWCSVSILMKTLETQLDCGG